MLNLNKTERAEIFIALSSILKTDDEPKTQTECARSAFVEAVAYYADDPNNPLERVLACADAVDFHLRQINPKSEVRYMEFDIDSLRDATQLCRTPAILALKMNGAQFNNGKLTNAPNSKLTEKIVFPDNLMDGF